MPFLNTQPVNCHDDLGVCLVAPGGKSVVHHDLIPVPQSEEPEPEDALVVPPLEGLAGRHHPGHGVRPLRQGGERGQQPAVAYLALVDVKPVVITPLGHYGFMALWLYDIMTPSCHDTMTR